MRLEWLEDILAVVDCGSFSDAADRRNLTQSAFSRRIKAIEDQIGVQLFDRAKKPVQLSQATLAHGDRIRELARELRQLTMDLRDAQKTAEHRVVIACQHAISTSLAPTMVRDLVRDEPLSIRLRSANLDECFGMLINGEAHITISYRAEDEAPPLPSGPFETLELGYDSLIPVAHPDLDLSGGRLPIVAYPREVFLGQYMNRTILPDVASRYLLERRVETALTTAALELAKNGVGVAWVPKSLVAADLASGALRQQIDVRGQRLSITAVRISGSASPVEERVWQRLPEIGLGAVPKAELVH